MRFLCSTLQWDLYILKSCPWTCIVPTSMPCVALPNVTWVIFLYRMLDAKCKLSIGWLCVCACLCRYCPHDGFEDKCRYCEKESVNVSLGNLLTFPWIKESVSKGELVLHGWCVSAILFLMKILLSSFLFQTRSALYCYTHSTSLIVCLCLQRINWQNILQGRWNELIQKKTNRSTDILTCIIVVCGLLICSISRTTSCKW